jgi:hypothetical protein
VRQLLHQIAEYQYLVQVDTLLVEEAVLVIKDQLVQVVQVAVVLEHLIQQMSYQ